MKVVARVLKLTDGTYRVQVLTRPWWLLWTVEVWATTGNPISNKDAAVACLRARALATPKVVATLDERGVVTDEAPENLRRLKFPLKEPPPSPPSAA